MTWLASLLVALGTIGASIAVARSDPNAEGWVAAWQVQVPLLVVSLLVVITGVVLLRRARTRAARRETGPGGTLSRARQSLATAATQVARLAERPEGGELAALHRALDELLTGPVAEFVKNRGAISEGLGMALYGEVMGAFSRGERYLNRAWSASVDGYLDEAETYVGRAVEPLEEASRRLAEGRRGVRG